MLEILQAIFVIWTLAIPIVVVIALLVQLRGRRWDGW